VLEGHGGGLGIGGGWFGFVGGGACHGDPPLGGDGGSIGRERGDSRVGGGWGRSTGENVVLSTSASRWTVRATRLSATSISGREELDLEATHPKAERTEAVCAGCGVGPLVAPAWFDKPDETHVYGNGCQSAASGSCRACARSSCRLLGFERI
jgi:hypothetical protein